MALPFTGTINVGGIQYTLDPTKLGMNYLYRSYHTFNETFKPVAERSGVSLSRIQQLFIKYFRVEPFVEQDFAAIVPDDKKDLIKIFEAYLKQLEINKSILPNSVISIMFNRTYYEISDILRQLTGKAKDFSKMSVTCQNSKKILGALTDEMKKQLQAEFIFLLSHPDEILSENGCTWADAIAGLVDIRLTDMTTRVMATKKGKKGQEGGGSLDDMKTHLTSILMVSNVLQAAKQCGCEDDKDYQELRQSLSNAMLPLYKEIKKLYKPVYGVIEQCMKRNRVKKHKIIMPLLQLQHLSNHFIGSRKEAYGIYRICHAGKRLVSYLTSQLQCISATLEKMKPAEQRAYHDVQKKLVPISPVSLPKRKAVASSKKGVTLPIVQFVTLDGNLTIPPYQQFYRKGSESEKEQYFQVMTDFFTKDHLYMIYSETDEVPLNFYEISLPSVTTTDRYIPITDYHSKRIINHHVLQDFATFVPHATYTNTELVLSIFIALKEKRTK